MGNIVSYCWIVLLQGFDITDYPGQCAMTTVYPMPFYLNDPKNVDMMTDYAGKALRQYNDEKVYYRCTFFVFPDCPFPSFSLLYL